jgi:hypothetical protein
MQKPHLAIIRVSQNGSVLVAVIAFITLMTIAMGGFLGVARNVVSQETMELNDDKAFLAAESGLLIGTRWLRESNNWIQYRNTGYNGTICQSDINGYTVTVTVVPENNGQLRIRSTTTGGILPYSKSLSWTVTEANWNNPGTFINSLAGVGGVGGGGLNNEWFDGPVHTNMPMYLASVSGGNVSVRFVNGKVSTHNLLAKVAFDAGNWGNYGKSPVSGNDYNFGIYMHDAQSGQYSKLDPLFELNGQYTEFQHSKDSLFMPRITTQTRTLPQNLSVNNKAILYFDVLNGTTGQATYYYYDATGNQLSTTFNNDNEIIRVPNDVQVLGTVKGQTTVVTDLGFHILPVGDIMYHGFTPDDAAMNAYNSAGNYGLGALTPLNKNVLALISGADIYFGTDKYGLSVDGGVASLTAISGKNNVPPVMYLTAQLIATENGNGIRWASKKVNAYNYKLSALGTRAVDTYEESHNAQGGPGNETFRFFFDTRFNDGLKSPGVPALRADIPSGEMFILNTDWTEENIIL